MTYTSHSTYDLGSIFHKFNVNAVLGFSISLARIRKFPWSIRIYLPIANVEHSNRTMAMIHKCR